MGCVPTFLITTLSSSCLLPLSGKPFCLPSLTSSASTPYDILVHVRRIMNSVWLGIVLPPSAFVRLSLVFIS